MKPYEHPAYSDPVVSNEEPDRDCHEWNFEPGDSDQEPYPNIMERIPKNAQAEALNYSFLLQPLTFR
ncbi:TPA: hypothetical protein ACLEBA_004589 [Pseudomonas aeruginosa]